MKTLFAAFTALCLSCIPLPAEAHPGGKDKNGCHTNKKTGERHGHPENRICGGKNSSSQLNLGRRPKIYANCAAFRAAGANPIRRGERGYGYHLDRDRDGIACECGPKGGNSSVKGAAELGCDSSRGRKS
jgi:hypothetical protein